MLMLHSRILAPAVARSFIFAVLCLYGVAAHGGEPAAKPEQARHIREIAGVLGKLAQAILDGNPAAVGRQLTPAYRDEVLTHVRGELAAKPYNRMAFDVPTLATIEWLDEGRVRLLIIARYRYRSTDGHLIAGRQAYGFIFQFSGGHWAVERSDLLDQFTGTSIQSVGWRLIALLVGGLLAVVFWGWMLFDCSIRYNRTDIAVAILLTPPIGALVYFFLGFLPAGPVEAGRARPKRLRS